MHFLQAILAVSALATTTSAWSFHMMNNAFDMTNTGDLPCTDFEVNGQKHEIKAGESYSWTNQDKKEPGLKKCCAFVYSDTGCRGGHEKIEHKTAKYGLGSLCKSANLENVGTVLKSFKVECKSRP